MKEQLRVINTSPLIIIILLLLLLLLSSSSVKAKCHSIVYGCWRVKRHWFKSEENQQWRVSSWRKGRSDLSINTGCSLAAFHSRLLCTRACTLACFYQLEITTERSVTVSTGHVSAACCHFTKETWQGGASWGVSL